MRKYNLCFKGYLSLFVTLLLSAFVLNLLLLSAHSSAFERPQHRLNFHLDVLGASRGPFTFLNSKDDAKTSYGISYDYVDRQGHSLGFESHNINSDSLIFMGYRYHTNIGIYVGLGFAGASHQLESGLCTAPYLAGAKCSESLGTSGLSLSLGYTYIFNSGFTLGASTLVVYPGVLSETLNVVTPSGRRVSDDKNIGISSSTVNIGLVLGYTWR